MMGDLCKVEFFSVPNGNESIYRYLFLLTFFGCLFIWWGEGRRFGYCVTKDQWRGRQVARGDLKEAYLLEKYIYKIGTPLFNVVDPPSTSKTFFLHPFGVLNLYYVQFTLSYIQNWTTTLNLQPYGTSVRTP
jgi:hypothetical protein